MNKKQLILKQVELNEEVKRLADINIVTCCDCGSVVLHKLKATKIACPYCLTIMPTGDFPDLLYIGMEIN